MNCPVCGSKDIDRIYRNQDGEIFGCEHCVKEDYAIDYEIAQAEGWDGDFAGWTAEQRYRGVCSPWGHR